MVTYDFYQNTYLGSQLSQTAFEKTVARAEAYIAKLERTCQVKPCGTDSRAKAVCAVAEKLSADSSISAASVGNVSVHYRDAGEKDLYLAAAMYLEIRRGVC